MPASHVHVLPIDGSSKYLIDCPFTARFVAEEKRWAFEEGTISWDDVLKRWKERGSSNEEFVEHIQRGYKESYGSTNGRGVTEHEHDSPGSRGLVRWLVLGETRPAPEG